MNGKVVSIRMPTSLVNELRLVAEQNHFKDISEAVRSVVRSRCLQFSNPFQQELHKFRQKLEQEFVARQDVAKKETLILELQRIVEELKNAK